MRNIFEATNSNALNDNAGEQEKLYARLKLEGFDQGPVQLAVFVDKKTCSCKDLGRKTMPEIFHLSVIAAINILWLAAQAQGLVEDGYRSWTANMC
jgi:5,6-dimethylbenzimidazole synthase